MTIALVVLVVIAVWVLSLYLKPFGPCHRCHGQGRIMRGSKQRPRPVRCARCHGVKRRQRRGSRTVHQLARRIRRERDRQRKLRATLTTTPKE